MKSRLSIFPALCLFSLLSLFSTISGFAAHPPALPSRALPVPLMLQATHYSCGAAALLSVLHYYHVFQGGEGSLYKDLQTTPKQGTEPPALVRVAMQYGLQAELRTGLNLQDLRDRLDDGTPVILDLQAWRDDKSPVDWKTSWDDGHYVVLVAMDTDYAYFMDPSAPGAYAFLPLSELLDRWHDFENRHGYVQRYIHAGVAVRGLRPSRSFPAPLIRIE